ncbi:hypothetical protein NKDENANG_03098 [Candidatus Entotheonellaceae bacterium PAL068K]
MVRLVYLVLIGCGALSQGCKSPEPRSPDVVPPHTHAVPAGGVYRTLPTQIALHTEDGAVTHYHWEGQPEQQYTGSIDLPEDSQRHLTLHFWSQDAAGNREPLRREHYVQEAQAAEGEILELDRTALGTHDTALLRWHSTASDATYEIKVTSGGWGPGRSVARGPVTPDAVQQTPIPGTALFPGINRLWLRIQGTAGAVGSTSRLLTLHAAPAITRAWPAGGIFGRPQTVQLFTQRPARIYYTTDGSEPSLNSPRYTTPLQFEQSTRLRYFSVDAYGNREAIRQETYAFRTGAPTIILQTLSGYDVGSAALVVFTWESDMAGRFEVALQPRHQAREVIAQQGKVTRQETIRSAIARNFLSGGDWRVQVRVYPPQGETGTLSFWLRVQYEETFADTRYHDTETTTTTTVSWDTARRHVRLTRGPRLLGTYRTKGRSRQVAVRGPYAYLANGRRGLHIVDVSTPHKPQRIGAFLPHGKAVALAKYGHYVYLATSGSGISIFDARRPSTPRLAAIVPLTGVTSDITIAAPYAYVGTQQGSVYIFDLSRPLHPRLVGQTSVGGRVVDMAVRQGIVYLACLDQGVIMVDSRLPQQPRLLRRWPTAQAATGIALHDQRAYVAAGALEVLDVRRPEAPVLLERQWMRGAYGVALLPPYVMVAAGSNGVMMWHVERPKNVQQRHTVHYAARLALSDTTLLVADTRGGLQILDLSQPSQPQSLGGLSRIGPIVDVVVDGALAYLASDRSGSRLVVVDISTPSVPRLLGQYHTESLTDVVLWQNLALVSDAAGILYVIDVQQPRQPRLLGSLNVSGESQRLALLPPYVLMASDRAGVHVVDITQPDRPQYRTTVPIFGRALDIALVDRTAYVAAVGGGIETLDLRDPLQPRRGVPYHHHDGKGDRIIRLAVDQQRLYAIDSQRGLQFLAAPINGPLLLRGSFAIPRGAPWALTTVGPYVFVTTLLNSLYVVDATDLSQPRLLSTAPYGGNGVYASDRRLYIAVRGSRGHPGGLRLIETFASVPQRTLRPLLGLGVSGLPGPTPETFLVNRAYTFNTPGLVQSTVLSTADLPIRSAVLRVQDFWGTSGHIRYELSNDGGAHWSPVQPGEPWHFTTPGTELRWRAILTTTDLTATPLIETMRIHYTTQR